MKTWVKWAAFVSAVVGVIVVLSIVVTFPPGTFSPLAGKVTFENGGVFAAGRMTSEDWKTLQVILGSKPFDPWDRYIVTGSGTMSLSHVTGVPEGISPEIGPEPATGKDFIGPVLRPIIESVIGAVRYAASLEWLVGSASAAESGYVQVTLTNSQTASTANPLQVQVIVNSSTFSAHEASDLGNVRWALDNANASPLYSWCESGCTSASTSTMYWVKVTSSISGSGGTLNIYMTFWGTLDTYSTAEGGGGTSQAGEYPTATGTYGQYDNGSNVFAYYTNFAGVVLPAGWSCDGINPGGGTVSVNNHLYEDSDTTNSNTGESCHVALPAFTASVGIVLDYHMDWANVTGSAYFGPALGNPSFGSGNPLYTELQQGWNIVQSGGNIPLFYDIAGAATADGQMCQNGVDPAYPCWGPTLGGAHVLSLSVRIGASDIVCTSIDYATSDTNGTYPHSAVAQTTTGCYGVSPNLTPVSVLTPGGPTYSSLFLYNNAFSGSSSTIYDWMRNRVNPPNETNPSSSVGSFTPSAAACGPTCYWVGGTGNWNDGTHWSTSSGGAAAGIAPTSTDAVVFDGNSGAGTATLNVDATVSSVTLTSSSLTLSGSSHTLTVDGAWNNANGHFSPSTGAVTMNPGGDVTDNFSGGTEFYTVNFYSSVTATITMGSGGFLANSIVIGDGIDHTTLDTSVSNFFVTSNNGITIGAHSTLTANGSTIKFVTLSQGTGSLGTDTSTFEITGSGGTSDATATFYNLTVDASVSTAFSGQINYSNDLTTGASSDLSFQNILSTSAGASLTAGVSSIFDVSGNWDTHLGSMNMNPSPTASTVRFTGTGNVNIGTGAFGAMQVNGGSAAITMLSQLSTAAVLTINGGALTLGGNATLGFGLFMTSGTFSVASYTIDVTGGNWNVSGGTFTTASSLVKGDVGGSHTLTMPTTAGFFYDLEILAGTWTLGSAIAVDHTLTVSNATFDTNSTGNYAVTVVNVLAVHPATFNLNASSIDVGASWDTSDIGAGSVNPGTSTVTMDGATNVNVTTVDDTHTNTFYDLVVLTNKSMTLFSSIGVGDVLFADGTINASNWGIGLSNAVTPSNGTPLQVGVRGDVSSVSSFDYSSNGALAIAPVDYNTLIVSAVDRSLPMSPDTLSAALVVGHTLSVSGAALAGPFHKTLSVAAFDVSVGDPFLGGGSVVVGASGILSATTSHITVNGNWDSSAGEFDYGTSFVEFTQNSFVTADPGVATFYDVQFDAPRLHVTLLSDVGVFDVVYLATSQFDMNGHTLHLGLGNTNAAYYSPLVPCDVSLLTCGGEFKIPQATFGTVEYDSTTYTILGGLTHDYANYLSLKGTAGRAGGPLYAETQIEVSADIDMMTFGMTPRYLKVNGGTLDFTGAPAGTVVNASSGVEIDLSADFILFGGTAWNVGGPWDNASTSSSWDAGTSTVTFDATVNESMTFGNAVSYVGGIQFHAAVFNAPTVTYTASDSIAATYVTVSAGTLDMGANGVFLCKDLNVSGDMKMDGVTVPSFQIFSSNGSTFNVDTWTSYVLGKTTTDIEFVIQVSAAGAMVTFDYVDATSGVAMMTLTRNGNNVLSQTPNPVTHQYVFPVHAGWTSSDTIQIVPANQTADFQNVVNIAIVFMFVAVLILVLFAVLWIRRKRNGEE